MSIACCGRAKTADGVIVWFVTGTGAGAEDTGTGTKGDADSDWKLKIN